ncbi:MAG TPA: HDOD domain-containing protein [bacterium]|nr:HDOD domain-containing protein [bacterium]
MDEKKAALVLRHIDRMPSLSPTVAKILQVANDPGSSANDLNKVISLDPVLAAKVLKLVNSAYFGFSEQVTSTVRAIVMLGLNTIKNLALSTAAMETLSSEIKGGGMNMDNFWQHVLATGVLAKLIAKKIDVNKNYLEDYFLGGLMHDIGKVVLNRMNPGGYGKVLAAAKSSGKPLYLYETAVFGINHAEIGKLLGDKWGLQPQLVDAMSLHHNSQQVAAENRKLVYTIIISNNFARKFEVGFGGSLYFEKIDQAVWAEVGIEEPAVDAMEGFLLEGVERASVFLQTAK